MDRAAAENPGTSSGLRSILIHNDSRAFPVQPSTRSIRSETAARNCARMGSEPRRLRVNRLERGHRQMQAGQARSSPPSTAHRSTAPRSRPVPGSQGSNCQRCPSAETRVRPSLARTGDCDKINSARTDMFQQAMQAGDAVGVNFRRPAAQAMRSDIGFHAKNDRAAETRPTPAGGKRPVAGNDPGKFALSNRPRAGPFLSISLQSADRISSAYHFPNFLSE